MGSTAEMSSILVFLALALSFVFWGLRRTAIWLIPGVFFPPYLILCSASLVSFFASIAVLAHFSDQAFDLRRWTKEKWVFSFFMTGILTGGLLYPVPLLYFGLGSLFPLACIQLYRLFRWPLGQVFVFPAFVRWIVLGIWILAILLRQIFHL